MHGIVNLQATPRQAAAALLQSYAGHGLKAMLQFGVGVILARLLGPEDFGLVAIAWIVVSISALVMDAGLSSSLIQAEKIDPSDVAYVFYLQLLISFAICTLSVIAGPMLAEFLMAPSAGIVIQVMALTFVFKAAGQTSCAILNRELRFGIIQIITVTSYGFGFGVVAIGLALSGYGVWSIVWASITQAALASAAYLWLARPPLKLTSLSPPRHMLQFGFKTMGANLLSWTILNADALIISRFLGPAALGLFNRTLALATIPTILVSSIQPLLFSNASRLQNAPEKIARAYLAATMAVALIVGPVLFTTAVVAQDVVVGLYGQAWKAAGPLLAPLALAMLANAFSLLGGPLLMSINQTHREIYAQALTALAMISFVSVAATHSLQSATWAILGAYLLRMILVTANALQALAIRTPDYIRALAPPLLVASAPPAIMAATVSAIIVDCEAEVRLALIICAASIGYGATILSIGPRLVSGPLSTILLSSGRLPRWAHDRLVGSDRARSSD